MVRATRLYREGYRFESVIDNMAIRIRKNGRIFCAALTSGQEGDTYVPDDIHYQLSVEKKILVTEYNDKHMKNAEWWWKGNIPIGIVIDNFYIET